MDYSFSLRFPLRAILMNWRAARNVGNSLRITGRFGPYSTTYQAWSIRIWTSLPLDPSVALFHFDTTARTTARPKRAHPHHPPAPGPRKAWRRRRTNGATLGCRHCGLRRRRVFKVCSFLCRIDSPNKACEVPHFTHVSSSQLARLSHCSLIVAAIDNVWRPRNAPVITKFIDTINCHGSPSEAREAIFHTRAARTPRGEIFDFVRITRLPGRYYP
jgi:hypothetical protein